MVNEVTPQGEQGESYAVPAFYKFWSVLEFWTLTDWCEKCFASYPHLRQSTLWGRGGGDIGQVYRNKPCLASKKILFVRDWRLLASRRKQNKVEAVNPREAILDLGVLFPCTMTLFYHIYTISIYGFIGGYNMQPPLTVIL